MEFKKGLGWMACYDEKRNIYTAERSWRGFYQLCLIDKETYDKLGVTDDDPDRLIGKGRHLVEADDDVNTAFPTATVYDENYHELAPWSDAKRRVEGSMTTGKELTDFMVEHFACEEKNRKHRADPSENP